MENENTKIEKAYDLLEQFAFTELSEEEKQDILSVMTESQYNEMRKTIHDMKVVLDKDIEPLTGVPGLPRYTSGNKFLRFIQYPVQLYQVAASIALILLTYFIIQKTDQNSTSNILASNDTVLVYQTDTVYTTVYDTVSIGETAAPGHLKYSKKPGNKKPKINTAPTTDCSRELCPNEVGKITVLNKTNNMARDSALKGLLLSLN